jgi:CHAD domain-containing protein
MRHTLPGSKNNPFNGAPPGGGPLKSKLVLPDKVLLLLAGAVKKQWKRYKKALRRCQSKFTEEAVHESRVETRRVLSMMELLRPFVKPAHVEQTRKVLKHHLDTFDDLRDTQVQLMAVSRLCSRFSAARAFYKHLRKCEERFTRKTRKNIKSIKSKRVARLIAACRKDVAAWREQAGDRSAKDSLLRAIADAFEETESCLKKVDANDTATIHRTRVAFKKYRYMVEGVSEYVSTLNQRQLSSMHHYQGLMGRVQDQQVLLSAWHQFARKRLPESASAQRFRLELVRRLQSRVETYLAAAGKLFLFRMVSRAPAGNSDIASPQLGRRARRQRSPRVGKTDCFGSR